MGTATREIDTCRNTLSLHYSLPISGSRVDREHLSRLSAEFAGEIEALEQEIYAEAGMPFTIGRPKQLGDVLFDKLGLKGRRKGKAVVYSTDVTELERRMKEGVPIATNLLVWRRLKKLTHNNTTHI